jgi:hypothetical protein
MASRSFIRTTGILLIRTYLKIVNRMPGTGTYHAKTGRTGAPPGTPHYVWLDDEGRALSRAWRYEDETERMAAECQPPSPEAILRAGTRQQLAERYGLHEEDFAD